jgi:hypothetical protein
MGRIRTIKPEMGRHEGLFDLEQETGLPIRFAWAMLQTACDREGRFDWRARSLKAEVLPLDDIDFSRVLHAWLTRGFVVRYRVGDAWYGYVPTFKKHQFINHREQPSDLPSPEGACETQDYRDQPLRRVDDASATREARVTGMPGGKGREGEVGKEGDTRETAATNPPIIARTKIVLTFPTDGDPGAWTLLDAQVQEWQAAYPSLDIMAQCREALVWVTANPGKRKKATGMPRFLVNWFNRSKTAPIPFPTATSKPAATQTYEEATAEYRRRHPLVRDLIAQGKL